MNQWVFQANESDFERTVLQASARTPVVVDFWAPWCGPCRTLTPLLERLAEEKQGEFLLAKVNVDENPGLSQAFRIQSIPRLIGFKGGRAAADLVGAVPEAELRRFLDQIVPTPAEKLATEGAQLAVADQIDAAEATWRRALELDPRCAPALLGLARLVSDRGDHEEALELLAKITGPLSSVGDHLAAEVRVRQGGQGNPTDLRTQIAAQPGDLDIRFQLAQILAARGEHEESLQQYLEIISRQRDFRDGAARKAMLDIFELLGSGNPLAERYRSELAAVLFR